MVCPWLKYKSDYPASSQCSFTTPSSIYATFFPSTYPASSRWTPHSPVHLPFKQRSIHSSIQRLVDDRQGSQISRILRKTHATEGNLIGYSQFTSGPPLISHAFWFGNLESTGTLLSPVHLPFKQRYFHPSIQLLVDEDFFNQFSFHLSSASFMVLSSF